MKKIMNMKKTFAAILAASVAASAASVAENQELLESKVDSINAKRGVEITGAIRAVAQTSRLDTDNDPTGKNHMPNVEKDEFVTADLNFGFRPWENVRANATLRLEAGMQEYFASAAKSISIPWLNAEGNLGNSFYWVVGDFRQQYSPLTLFLPSLEIMYEPQIFARKRYMAEHEQFIEGNQRNLQGVNLQFRTNLNESVGEVRAEALFARINRTAVLDLTGAEGNILPSDEVWGASQSANMDKFLLAGNFEILPLNRSLYVGATPMYIFDNKNSYSYAYRHPHNDQSKPYEAVDINPYDLNPQETFVLSGRVGADVAALTGNKNLVLDVMGEFAMSNDKVYKADSSVARNEGEDAWKEVLDYNDESIVVVPETDSTPEQVLMSNLAKNDGDEYYLVADSFMTEKQTGIALLVNANLGYKTDDWGARVAVDFVMNDSAWFNNLAQSPRFFAQRILNSDKDGLTVKYGVNSPLYSSFDALYNFSPKFSPVALGGHASAADPLKPVGTNDDAFKNSSVSSYNIANYNKNSWTTNVYTRNQLALLETLTDPALQLSLPNGLATANRVGARVNLIANVKDFAEVQGLFSMFNQVKGETKLAHVILADTSLAGVNTFIHTVPFAYKPAKYTEFGGGAKIDIFKMVGFSKPLEISGSYKHSERTIDTDDWASVGGVDMSSSLKSDFINAGLYVQYLPRLGFNAGFQMINTKFENTEISVPSIKEAATLMKGTQMQWMVGVDYNIAPNAWLAINVGKVNVRNEYDLSEIYDRAYAKEYNRAYAEAYREAYQDAGVDFDINGVADAEARANAKAVADSKAGEFAEGAAAYAQDYMVNLEAENLPDYYTNPKSELSYKSEFSQFILEASLNVEF